MVEVNVPAESTLKQLHECKCGGHDHLEDVIRGMTDQLSRGRFEIEHPPQKRCRGNEKFRQIVASCIGPKKYKIT